MEDKIFEQVIHKIRHENSQKHIKRRSTSLLVREMLIKSNASHVTVSTDSCPNRKKDNTKY